MASCTGHAYQSSPLSSIIVAICRRVTWGGRVCRDECKAAHHREAAFQWLKPWNQQVFYPPGARCALKKRHQTNSDCKSVWKLGRVDDRRCISSPLHVMGPQGPERPADGTTSLLGRTYLAFLGFLKPLLGAAFLHISIGLSVCSPVTFGHMHSCMRRLNRDV